MYIELHTVVDIMAKDHAGKRGVVTDIRISDYEKMTIVFVSVFNPQSGACTIQAFKPTELEISKLSAIKIERFQLLAMADRD